MLIKNEKLKSWRKNFYSFIINYRIFQNKWNKNSFPNIFIFSYFIGDLKFLISLFSTIHELHCITIYRYSGCHEKMTTYRSHHKSLKPTERWLKTPKWWLKVLCSCYSMAYLWWNNAKREYGCRSRPSTITNSWMRVLSVGSILSPRRVWNLRFHLIHG